MIKTQKYNNTLYELKYIKNNNDEYINTMFKLSKHKKILKDAIDNNYIYIMEGILLFYNIIDKKIYDKLINKIYSNKNNFKIDNISLLELSLLNTQLNLEKSQKQLAIKYIDLSYNFLKNNSFTLSEKKNKIYTLNNKEWDLFLDNLEENLYEYIVKKGYNINLGNLYDYELKDLIILFKNSKFAKEILNEINFLKQLHIIRPQQWENDNIWKGKSKIIKF